MMSYLDDILLMEILVALGFVINTKKSVFQPSQRIEFLGFT